MNGLIQKSIGVVKTTPVTISKNVEVPIYEFTVIPGAIVTQCFDEGLDFARKNRAIVTFTHNDIEIKISPTSSYLW